MLVNAFNKLGQRALRTPGPDDSLQLTIRNDSYSNFFDDKEDDGVDASDFPLGGSAHSLRNHLDPSRSSKVVDSPQVKNTNNLDVDPNANVRKCPHQDEGWNKFFKYFIMCMF